MMMFPLWLTVLCWMVMSLGPSPINTNAPVPPHVRASTP
jgi:hypothetical protein